MIAHYREMRLSSIFFEVFDQICQLFSHTVINGAFCYAVFYECCRTVVYTICIIRHCHRVKRSLLLPMRSQYCQSFAMCCFIYLMSTHCCMETLCSVQRSRIFSDRCNTAFFCDTVSAEK